jgi:hypothetical protein
VRLQKNIFYLFYAIRKDWLYSIMDSIHHVCYLSNWFSWMFSSTKRSILHVVFICLLPFRSIKDLGWIAT